MGRALPWQYNDGGRKLAGYWGAADDCVCRAVAIAEGVPYKVVYDSLNDFVRLEKQSRGKLGRLAATGRGSSARTGVYKTTTRAFLESRGWRWVPTMGVGTGCRVHLAQGELPPGRLIVAVSRHVVAVLDGVIHDNHNPTRSGSRCVYGYWQK